jgi:3-hydroxyisobutyrate dehydrogenase-like beta-hydroxyacid dehydrogenase
MGGAIARNLIERGWTVVGFDTERSRRSELEQAGASIVDGASAVASHATTVMTSLPNADAERRRSRASTNSHSRCFFVFYVEGSRAQLQDQNRVTGLPNAG